MGLSKGHEQLGKNIRKFRDKRGMTIEDLSSRADIDPSYLGYLERGEKNATVARLFDIADALRVKVSDLLKGA